MYNGTMKAKKSRITLEDIAKKIGISRTTIYKVINNKGIVTEKTRREVLQALHEYNYHPNKAARNLAMGKEFHIGFIGFRSSRSSQFIDKIQAGVRAAAADLHDYGVHIEEEIFDLDHPEDQRSALREMAKEGMDAFLLIPNDIKDPEETGKLVSLVNELVDGGFPLYTVNRDLLDCKRQRYIGCDYYKSGSLAAELMGKMARPGKVVVPLGGREEYLYDIRYRLQGFKERIESFSHLQVLPYYRHISDDPGELESYFEDVFRKHPDISAVFDLTYELDVVSRAVAGKTGIKTIGFDLSEKIKEHMLDHTVDAIVYQDMFSQGFLAVKGIYSHLNGEEKEPQKGNIITKLELVLEENLDFYI